MSGKMYTVIWVSFFFTIVLVFKNWTSTFRNSLESVLLASSCPELWKSRGVSAGTHGGVSSVAAEAFPVPNAEHSPVPLTVAAL